MTSMTLKVNGAGGSADFLARGGRSSATTASSRSTVGFFSALSSGTTCAPVPFVSLSSSQVFPTHSI
jgi:hypothetical protein